MNADIALVVLRGLMISSLMAWAAVVPVVWLVTDPVPGKPWRRCWWEG